MILSATITGVSLHYEDIGDTTTTIVVGGIGLLFIPPLLMILFREKYPRWWFDWNLNFQRFSNRIGIYLALMDDRYPSTDEDQSVRLEYPYPDPRTTSAAQCHSSNGSWRSRTTWCCSSSPSGRCWP